MPKVEAKEARPEIQEGRDSAPVNLAAVSEIPATDEETRLVAELRAAARYHDWEDAQRILGHYDGSNSKVLVAAMHAAVKCRKYEDGATIFESLNKSGEALDVSSYSLAMNIFGKLGETEKVEEIWAHLLEKGTVDQVAGGARIAAAAASGDIQVAQETLKYMKKKRLDLKIFHFASAINACAKSNAPDRDEVALRLFNEMIARGLKPNIFTYNSFVQASSDLPRKDLLAILDNMDRKKVQADAAFAQTFLIAFLALGKGDRAFWTMDNLLIEFFNFPREDLEKASEVIKNFKRKGVKLSPWCNRIESALQQQLKRTELV